MAPHLAERREREREVLALVARGVVSRETAHVLFTGEATAKAHLTHLSI